ncbi:MAG TPA: AraC family transcriptional regulator [Anaerohalosphaeraceae bacterium]|nr:AraC family transcriptional regulator [Anaerohalosphaeraceae bacterium]
METQLRIIECLKTIIAGPGITEVIFAGNKTPPPLLAFAVHFPRLTLLTSGTYTTELEQNRKVTSVSIQPGQALFIPPNCWDKPDMNTKSQAIHFLFGKRHTGISLVTSNTEVKADKIALQHTLAGPEQKLIDSILELNQMKKPYSAFNHLIMALLSCYIIRLEEYNKPLSKHSNLLFQEICIYIQENFQNELSRDSVAKYYDISPNHLSRMFKTNGYMKFCDYVNYVRINRAKFLLQNYDFSLYHIAQRCGYNDVVYFCRIFKKITKKTPKQYRNQLLYNNSH